MKRLLLSLTIVIFHTVLCVAQAGLKINELFEGRIIPQEKMVETRVRGKTLAKYRLTYYRSVRFNATEEEADRLLQMVEADGKGHFATGSDKTGKTMYGKEHSITFKTQVRKQGDKNCFLCYQALWRGNNPERQVTVIYMEGPVRSLEQLEELLKN
ncbi:MAG: hypothetical protein IJ533_05650 [Prevotella sp.]|nr:hypothetical protein [Prevotella sp.]